MSDLLLSTSSAAQFAVDYFCRDVAGAIGSLAARAGGIDALVFTGGIGEHASLIREKICAPLAFMGISLDDAANRGTAINIHRGDAIPVLVIAADEEAMIHLLCKVQIHN